MTEAVPTPDDDIAAPRAPHDDLTFEALAARYNYALTSFDPRVLVRLIMKECEARSRPVSVLDVGCGRGVARRVEYQWAIRRGVDDYWGLEPDPGATPPPGLFDHHLCALMEDADLPPDTFDVAYSSMVIEHVADPEAFLEAMWRCLKPGGVHLFLTPNKRCYFARTASLLHSLRLDEFVLRKVIRGNQVDEYHFPVQYRLNDKRRIDACAARAGFRPPEYAYVENENALRGYFPGPFRVFFHMASAKRRLYRKREVLGRILCRLTKPD